jgi:hypothetical protein
MTIRRPVFFNLAKRGLSLFCPASIPGWTRDAHRDRPGHARSLRNHAGLMEKVGEEELERAV